MANVLDFPSNFAIKHVEETYKNNRSENTHSFLNELSISLRDIE